jgi:hypothetical protein
MKMSEPETVATTKNLVKDATRRGRPPQACCQGEGMPSIRVKGNVHYRVTPLDGARRSESGCAHQAVHLNGENLLAVRGWSRDQNWPWRHSGRRQSSTHETGRTSTWASQADRADRGPSRTSSRAPPAASRSDGLLLDAVPRPAPQRGLAPAGDRHYPGLARPAARRRAGGGGGREGSPVGRDRVPTPPILPRQSAHLVAHQYQASDPCGSTQASAAASWCWGLRRRRPGQ